MTHVKGHKKPTPKFAKVSKKEVGKVETITARSKLNVRGLVSAKQAKEGFEIKGGELVKKEKIREVRPGEDIKETFGMEDKLDKTELGTEAAPKGEILTPEALEINNIKNKLAQPETGKILDTINRWRLEIQLENALKKQEKTARGELQPFGAIALGTNVGIIARGGDAWAGVEQALWQMRATTIGAEGFGVGQAGGFLGKFALGTTGMQAAAINSKTIALTGIWLKRAGFTTRAAIALGSLIGLTAWGKHVKSEAIEFLPFQITKAREAGDEAGALELEQLHAEIADPTGWANIIEEIPGLGVIKAAIDKTRVGTAIIAAQKKRA